MLYNQSMAKAQGSCSLDLLFRALADPTRLRLLNLIADREICVCYFVEILRMSQPKISRHLAYLRRAGIVAARREGKWMHYRLAIPKDQAAAGILRETLKHLRQTPEMKRDVSRLSSACCSPQDFALLQGAPQPALLAAARN
jgi:ArsR family transcriptional regulator, arsenate/arsenite/antimonite-responsive transcriptional repressor